MPSRVLGFIEAQCDEKIRRALRHQVRCHLETYKTGDKVYFKRDDSNRWRGPGTVIGQDRQVVFVRHGGVSVSYTHLTLPTKA